MARGGRRSPRDERERRTDVRATSTLIAKATGLLSLAGVAVALTACGGADPAASTADADAKAEKARLRLEQCLRENGLDIQKRDGGRRTIVRADDAKARTAMQKCRKYQQEAFGAVTPEQRQEFRDAFAKFSACMRQHGVDLPDPTTAGGPGSAPTIRRGQAGPGARIDRASPKMQAAMKACEDKLPRGRGMRLAGPGGPRG
jgi:hypothetical protein